MSLCESFPPLAPPQARLLILGSMPGAASLRAGQYYAHPQNQFWPIMAALLCFDPALPYAQRCAALASHGIAVWDVLQSCVRPGSLDADIDPASSIANDFRSFFTAQPRIRRVCFNGATAENLFRRQKLNFPAIEFIRLPSTSPAHAGMRRDAKLQLWREALQLPG